MRIELTEFAKRHFNKEFNGTKILDKTPEEFIDKINETYNYRLGISHDERVQEGYADFCKLFFLENFTNCKTGTMEITMENYQYIRSDYSSRRESELPVMSRWLEIPNQFIPKAKWLNIILYTKDQLYKEWESNPSNKSFELSDDCEYGVVAILGQMVNYEEPMKPETMIRNYMPLEYGGSGMEYPTSELDKIKFNKDYLRSVSFWEKFITVK